MSKIYGEILSLKCINSAQVIDEKDLLGKVLVCLCLRPSLVLSEIYLQSLLQWAEHYREPMLFCVIYSPKFPREGEEEVVQHFVAAHCAEVPVFVDTEGSFAFYHQIQQEPAIVIYDPLGRRRFVGAGDIDLKASHELCLGLMKQALAAKKIRGSHSLLLRKYSPPIGLLNHPSRILVDRKGERLFIADSGGHRLLQCDLTGKIQQVMGSGQAGDQTGSLSQTQFRRPTALALQKDELFVADSGNHRIKAIDLRQQQSRNLVGTGVLNFHQQVQATGQRVSLSSPRDLCFWTHEDTNYLCIGNTGSRQILRYDLDTDRVESFIGNGRKAQVDDIFKMSSFHQPSAFCTDLPGIFLLADNAPARICWLRDGQVRSVYRSQEDVESPLQSLQYPTAMQVDKQGNLWILDSMERKILIFDLRSKKFQSDSIELGSLVYPVDMAFLPSGDLLVLDQATALLWQWQASSRELREFSLRFHDDLASDRLRLEALPDASHYLHHGEIGLRSLDSIELQIYWPQALGGTGEEAPHRLRLYERHKQSWYRVREIAFSAEKNPLSLHLYNVNASEEFVIDLHFLPIAHGGRGGHAARHYRLHIQQRIEGEGSRPVKWRLPEV